MAIMPSKLEHNDASSDVRKCRKRRNYPTFIALFTDKMPAIKRSLVLTAYFNAIIQFD